MLRRKKMVVWTHRFISVLLFWSPTKIRASEKIQNKPTRIKRVGDIREWKDRKSSGKVSRAEKAAYTASAEVVLMRSKPFPATELQLSSSTRGPRNPRRKTPEEQESLQPCACQMIIPPWQESRGLVHGAIESDRCFTRKREIHCLPTERRENTLLYLLSPHNLLVGGYAILSVGIKTENFSLVKLNSLRNMT